MNCKTKLLKALVLSGFPAQSRLEVANWGEDRGGRHKAFRRDSWQHWEWCQKKHKKHKSGRCRPIMPPTPVKRYTQKSASLLALLEGTPQPLTSLAPRTWRTSGTQFSQLVHLGSGLRALYEGDLAVLVGILHPRCLGRR